MSQGERIVAFADKTVLLVSGLAVKGLRTDQLEEILMEKFASVVRVIGVTGDHVEMDVYGIEPEYILKNEDDIIQAVACADGITLTELAQITQAEKAVAVDYEEIETPESPYCPWEKWRTV